MPQFVLNTPPRPTAPKAVRHGYFDLDDFARGYIEAMFFTNGDTGDDDRLNDLGVERLTREALASIEADCDRFYRANVHLLRQAFALEPGAEDFRYASERLDDRRAGHLFWYARQGHGAGWTDYGDAKCLEALQAASQTSGNAYCEVHRGWIYHR